MAEEMMTKAAAMPNRAGLTKAQEHVARRMLQGAPLERHFDVWAGMFWTLGGEAIVGRTAECLIEKGYAQLGEDQRRYSGHRAASATLTEAGRAALSEAGHG